MTSMVRTFLRAFDRLSEADKQDAVMEILRRSWYMDLPPLTDNELIIRAESCFLELDSREDNDDSTATP